MRILAYLGHQPCIKLANRDDFSMSALSLLSACYRDIAALHTSKTKSRA
jgi:hypothetical protein